MESTAQQFASGLVQLLKEYTDKVSKKIELAKKVRDQSRIARNSTPELEIERRAFSPMYTALLDITRQASQLSEQGAIDDLTRLELRLRRAELETALSTWGDILHLNV